MGLLAFPIKLIIRFALTQGEVRNGVSDKSAIRVIPKTIHRFARTRHLVFPESRAFRRYT
jgi:hypothetical protein